VNNCADAQGRPCGSTPYTSNFLDRPASASEWAIEIDPTAAATNLNDMDLRFLDDVEINFSTYFYTRDPVEGRPNPAKCARIDF